MSQVIRISDSLYKRLEVHATGFDSPSSVIERILNAYEGVEVPENSFDEISIMPESSNKLEIIYFSTDEEAFKERFLDSKKAFVKIFYANDTSEIKEWNASRFTKDSKVEGNLRSGYLRGWKKKGILKAEVAIDKNDIQ